MIPDTALEVPLEVDRIVTLMFGLGVALVLAFGLLGKSQAALALAALFVVFQPLYLMGKSIRTERGDDDSEPTEKTEETTDEAAEN